MNILSGVARRALAWNVAPLVLTWVLLAAVAAGFYSARAEPNRAFTVLASITTVFFGTLAVAVPVILVDLWSWTKQRSLQILAVLPLIAAEFFIGLILSLPIVTVTLFGFLQWIYWTFMCFARDTSAPATEPVIVAETEPPGPGPGPGPGPVIVAETAVDGFGTDTTIDNLEASMVELANQIMEEK